MTDKPQTLSIDQTEWRVLFAANIQRMNEFISANFTMTVEDLKSMHDHLDRAKLLATAWHRASPPIKPAATAEVPAQGNGAQPVKKRRGRPPNAEKAAQAQVVQ